MKRRAIVSGLASLLLVVFHMPAVGAEPPVAPAAQEKADTYPIDLPTALSLAGADNLDVQIARQRLAEANASKKIALESIFPSLSGGVAYRRHEGAIQDVQGTVENVNKESYTPGATLALEADIGDAIFRSLEARQLVKAAGHEVDAERQRVVVAAAGAYMDLVKAHALIRATDEALQVSQGYSDELANAVKNGIAFEGDALQAKGKASEDRIARRAAEESARVAAVRLAGVVNLDPVVKLVPRDAVPVPLTLCALELPVEEQVAAALAARPEVKQRAAEVEAARAAERGAKFGPLAPSLTGQVFAGGLGGGQDGGPHHFDDSEDYYVGLHWKLGPGGLFDVGRIESSHARMQESELKAERTRMEIAQQVISGRERVNSLSAQVAIAERSLTDAREALRLRQERKDFGVAAVLEVIQAERDWTHALDDYLTRVTDYNKAQYELLRVTGGL